MRWLLLTLFYTFVFDSGYSQILTIVDGRSKEPLEMVTITSENPRAFTVTNAKGQADIHLFNGSESIEFRMLGYTTIRMKYSEIVEQQLQIALTESGIALDELVISGTRWSQTTNEVPYKITSISSRSIALQNPQTSADMLAASGDVFIQKSQQGGGSPMIRGFSTNRLLYVVDGIRMNTAIFRSGNIQNVISVDPFTNEKVEILFGPGSVIYGSDAIGGVMNFTTLSPQFSFDSSHFSGQATFRYASANQEKTGHLHLNAGWKRWALVSSYSHFDFDDLKMGSHGPDDYLRTFYVDQSGTIDLVKENDDQLLQTPSGYSQNNFMQKVSFKYSDQWKFDYIFHYSETSDVDRYDRLIRTNNDLPRSAEWYYGPQKWMMNQLAITGIANSGIYDQFTIRMAHQFFEESRNDRDFGDTQLKMRVEKVNAYSLNFDLMKFLGDKHQLAYGLEGVMNDVNSTGTGMDIVSGVKSPAPSRYPQSVWQSYAAYFNLQHQLSGKFNLTWGARYSYYHLHADFDTTFYPFPFTETTVSNSSLSGSIGFVYRPSESWVMSLNGSTGYRSPNVDDIGKVFDSEPGSVVVPNPDLKAEMVYNAEFGITKVVSDFLKVDLTAFYTILDDAMVRRDFRLNGMDSLIYDGELSNVQAIQNASTATAYGIQAGVEVKIVKGLQFSSRISYQQGEEELDDGTTSPLRHIAPLFGATHLTYNYRKFILDLYTVYNGELSYNDLSEESKSTDYLFAKDENGNPYSPSWYTLNLKLSVKFSTTFSLNAGIENITDQRYKTYSSGIAAAGRNYIAALNIKF